MRANETSVQLLRPSFSFRDLAISRGSSPSSHSHASDIPILSHCPMPEPLTPHPSIEASAFFRRPPSSLLSGSGPVGASSLSGRPLRRSCSASSTFQTAGSSCTGVSSGSQSNLALGDSPLASCSGGNTHLPTNTALPLASAAPAPAPFNIISVLSAVMGPQATSTGGSNREASPMERYQSTPPPQSARGCEASSSTDIVRSRSLSNGACDHGPESYRVTVSLRSEQDVDGTWPPCRQPNRRRYDAALAQGPGSRGIARLNSCRASSTQRSVSCSSSDTEGAHDVICRPRALSDITPGLSFPVAPLLSDDRRSSDTDSTAQSAVELSPKQSAWQAFFGGGSTTTAPQAAPKAVVPTSPARPATPASGASNSPKISFTSLQQLLWSGTSTEENCVATLELGGRHSSPVQLHLGHLDRVKEPGSFPLLDITGSGAQLPPPPPRDASNATTAGLNDPSAEAHVESSHGILTGWFYRALSAVGLSKGHVSTTPEPDHNANAAGSGDGSGGSGESPIDEPRGGAHAATPAIGTCSHIEHLIPDHLLFQVAALLGEPVTPSALQQVAGQPLGCGPGSLLGEAAHLEERGHTEASRRFEKCLDKGDAKLNIHYTIERRLQRHNNNAHRTQLRIGNATAEQVRAFLLSDEVVKRATAIVALERLPPPGEAVASESDSALIYQCVQLPKPGGRRQYIIVRRVWDRAEDGGFYSVTRPCHHPLGEQRVQTSKGGNVEDFCGGYLVRCALRPADSFLY
jgi:hypothetical protein